MFKNFIEKNQKTCFLEYFSTGLLKTKVHYPFLALNDCNKNLCNGGFLCKRYKYCIPIEKVCDGVNHCWNSEDELNCGRYLEYGLQLSIVNISIKIPGRIQISGFFKCKSENKYINISKICDGIIHCNKKMMNYSVKNTKLFVLNFVNAFQNIH